MIQKALVAVMLLAVVSASALFFPSAATRAQDLTPEERAVLQAQLAEYEKEIAEQQQIIKETQAKKNTLQGDVTLLNAKIKAAQAQINAKNIAIKQLSAQIAKKNAVIGQLSERIERGKEALASILRQEDQLDRSSIIAVAFSNEDLSSFFADLDAFFFIKTDLRVLFADIRDAKMQTEKEKADLAVKQNQTTDAKYVIETQKQQVASDKTQKQQLLTITANQETEYKKVLAERQAKAAAIRAALFPLRDAGAITFGDALKYAQSAGAKTGIRSALILAFLSQESNLGVNVGQCYLADPTTGAGVGKNTGTAKPRTMSPIRDVPPFTDLGLRLGFNPLQQVVSCWQPDYDSKGNPRGWGGAMGPAQFIPSTWIMFEPRIAAATGHSTPNPWSAEDAIMANALYISDLGAGRGGYTAESEAACRYFSGSSCSASSRIAGYGQSVVAKADSYQSNIDFLSNN